MEYKEDEYLMLSGIQHFKFCRRQWALIHIEQEWGENVHTVIGELMHKIVHDPYLREKRKDTIIVRALPVSSKTLGISGECDVVEFHKCQDGISLFGHRGLYSVFPVEYKIIDYVLFSVGILLITGNIMYFFKREYNEEDNPKDKKAVTLCLSGKSTNKCLYFLRILQKEPNNCEKYSDCSDCFRNSVISVKERSV